MKIKDIISAVDKTKPICGLDSKMFDSRLGTDVGWLSDEGDAKFNSRIKGYPIVEWYCTDRHVGLYVYFFDDKPVSVHWQRARKSDKEVLFIDPVLTEELRMFLLSLQEPPNNLHYVNLEADMDLKDINYKLDFDLNWGYVSD